MVRGFKTRCCISQVTLASHISHIYIGHRCLDLIQKLSWSFSELITQTVRFHIFQLECAFHTISYGTMVTESPNPDGTRDLEKYQAKIGEILSMFSLASSLCYCTLLIGNHMISCSICKLIRTFVFFKEPTLCFHNRLTQFWALCKTASRKIISN